MINEVDQNGEKAGHRPDGRCAPPSRVVSLRSSGRGRCGRPFRFPSDVATPILMQLAGDRPSVGQ